MARKTKRRSVDGVLRYIQNLFDIKDRKIFLVLTVIALFVTLYTLFIISQQVSLTDWVYSGNFERSWVDSRINTSNWKPISLPSLESKKLDSMYYRGYIELSGIIKPDVVIKAKKQILGIYVNGVEVETYNSSATHALDLDAVVLKSSLFQPGKNLLAIELSGGHFKTLSISTEKTGIKDSKLLLLFFVTPLLLFLILDKKSLDSNKTALIIFLIVTIIFLEPMFHDFNYWGAFDWDYSAGFNALPRDTILNYHQLPLWTPYYSGGLPSLADPQSMWLSPLFPLILLFNVISGLKLQVILWYTIGLFGMYLIGKQLKLGTYSRYLMAFALIFSSYSSLRVMAGQFTAYHISILPWIFLFYLKALEDKKYVILSALATAFMLFGGGLYTIVFTVTLLTLYALATSAKKWFDKEKKSEILNPLVTLLIIGLICSGLSAIKAVPMIELSMKYQRLTEVDPATYNGYTLGSLYYAFLGSKQMKYVGNSISGIRADWDLFGAYIGPIVMLLALGGIIFYFRKQWPLVFIILFGVLISFGTGQSGMVLWNLIHKLPIFSSLRHPSRFILLALFPLTIFAGIMASRIEKKKAWAVLVLAVFVFYNLLLINNPTINDAFTIAPREIAETRFMQLVDRPEAIFVYSEAYHHFLQNQGIINGYGSLLFLSNVPPFAHSVGDLKYHGEVYLNSNTGNVTLKSFSPNRLVVQVNADGPDTLIINQNYDKGWKSPNREIYAKNGLIAVDVSQQDKEILLYYSPTSFKIGLIITLLTILILAYYMNYRQKRFKVEKFIKSLKNEKFILLVIIIILLSTYGVDMIQSSGFYVENQTLLNGPGYTIPNTITSGVWLATELGHDIGGPGLDGGWESEEGSFGYLTSGPYVNLKEGKYNVTFRIKINNNAVEDTNKVVTIEVARNRGLTVVAKDLYLADFRENNTYQDFILTFETQKPLVDIEFRTHYAMSPATVSIDEIMLDRI